MNSNTSFLFKDISIIEQMISFQQGKPLDKSCYFDIISKPICIEPYSRSTTNYGTNYKLNGQIDLPIHIDKDPNNDNKLKRTLLKEIIANYPRYAITKYTKVNLKLRGPQYSNKTYVTNLFIHNYKDSITISMRNY